MTGVGVESRQLETTRETVFRRIGADVQTQVTLWSDCYPKWRYSLSLVGFFGIGRILSEL
jgi:hypothetical protein